MVLPIAFDDLYSVLEDDILRINVANSVINNDTDGDNDKLAASVVSRPVNPLFDFKTNGTFVYDARYHDELTLGSVTLANGFNSLAAGAAIVDSFTYVASDGQGNSNIATVEIEIVGENDDPVADDDFGTFDQSSDTVITIDALAGDTDVDVWPTPDTLSISSLSDIADDGGSAGGSGTSILTDSGGNATIVDGQIQYVAADGFFGIDTFEYTVSDGNGGTDTGLVRITVLPDNIAPIADDDTRTIIEDAGATELASVLGNDTDADDDPLIGAELLDPIGSALRRVDSDGNPISGDTGILVDFNSDGTFTYDPNGEFESLGVGESAFVQFDYQAFDGKGEADTATVTLEITGENDPPSFIAPEDMTVYEAGLSDGSGDGPTTITTSVDITLSDPDSNDNPFIVGSTFEGTYGTLTVVDEDTVSYTLETNADHADIQGHNGGITDSFELTVSDGNGGTAGPVTVTVNIIDDINFLGPVDDTQVDFATNASVTGDLNLIPGADGQTLDILGIPDTFTLADGRTVTSSVVGDTVVGTDSNGALFYELTFDPDAGTDGEYAFTMLQDPPLVVNPIDFSSVSAGGPQETLTAESVTFDGKFVTLTEQEIADFPNNAPIIEPNATDDAGGDDDINPNNAGGIGVGNGNIEQTEALLIDVSDSTDPITGIQFEIQGVGGGIGTIEVLYEAYDNDILIDSGSIEGVNLGGKDPATIAIELGQEFDELYVLPILDDGNDKLRINEVSTLSRQENNDFALTFGIQSTDGDGDIAPDPFAQFTVGIDGNGDNAIVSPITPDLILV